MSLLSLEILFRAFVIPSCTYGPSAISNQLRQYNYEFLDVVQGRLVKLWFGVSRFASTSSLVSAVEWEKASDLEWEKASGLVRTSHETRTALVPVSVSTYTMSCMPSFPTGITRRNIGLWLSNGLQICFVNPDSVIYQTKGVYVNYVIALPTTNHTSYIAGGRLKMSPLNVNTINTMVKTLKGMTTS